MSGIPTSCTLCGARLLNPHELSGVCRECKLVLRNERLADTHIETRGEMKTKDSNGKG